MVARIAPLSSVDFRGIIDLFGAGSWLLWLFVRERFRVSFSAASWLSGCLGAVLGHWA